MVKPHNLDVKRLVDELGINDTDYVFVYDSDGNPKEIYIPYQLEDDDLMPESVSATLDLFCAVKTTYNTLH